MHFYCEYVIRQKFGGVPGGIKLGANLRCRKVAT